MSILLFKRIRFLSRIPEIKCMPTSQFAFFFSSVGSDETPSPSKPSISTVVLALTNHRSKSRWRYLQNLCSNGFEPDEFSQITLHLRNNPHLALSFFRWTESKSLCHHNLFSYSTVIHILARGRLKFHALNLIQTAIQAAVFEDNDTESRPFSNSLKVFETLVKTYRQCDSAPFVFDLLIKALLDSKKVDASIQIVRMLRSRGISPKIDILNSLISLVSQCQGSNAGYGVYKEFFGEISAGNMKRVRQVSPNVRTFNALMVSFFQDGLVEEVKEIWENFGKSNLVPNVYSFNIWMAALCEAKKMDEVDKLWEEMKHNKLNPDVVSYNTLIGGFCKIGDLKRADELFKEMELSGIDGTCTTYEHLVHGYSIIGNVDSAMLVYKAMCRKHFRLSAFVMEELIRGFFAKRRVSEIFEILRSEMVDCHNSPTGKSYELLIKGLCEEGKIDEAFKLQAKMVGKGFKSNAEIYSAFINCYMKQGNKKMAEMLTDEMLAIHYNQK